MRVHILPIEPIPMRYTKDWIVWFPDEFRRLGATVYEHLGSLPSASKADTKTAFADWAETWAWKGSQLAEFASRFGSDVRDGDWVLSLEGWGPAQVAVKYMGAMTGKRIQTACWFHAGRFDPWDRLSQVPQNDEGAPLDSFERALFDSTDLVLCGSNFCVDMIMRAHPEARCRFAACGYPVYRTQPVEGYATRERAVVFPHRLVPEKDVQRSQRIQALVQEENRKRGGAPIRFIVTQLEAATKKEYYSLLSASRVAYSTARQETFGIAMQEAAAAGCWIVCPNDLCYPEVVRGAGAEYLYDTDEDAAKFIIEALDRNDPAPWDGWHENAIERAFEALRNYDQAL